MQFHLPRMLGWIDSIFDTQSDRIHAIGRKALKNLIIHNRGQPYLLEWSIEKCFAARSAKALESCFEVITQILIEHEDYQLPFWKVLGAGLYTLGNESSQIRMKSTRLLRTMEERQHKQSKLQDLDISISDKTTAVYKQAQFEMSCKLADQHSELAFHVFSEFSRHFRALQPDHQRNMVAAMLPWLHKIQLQIDLRGEPTARSYMLLVNLFEITIVCSSTALHNEVLGLWKAVASGPYGGNVKVVLDFIKNLCLEKREQNFVDYAKQIVVFLSGTPAGMKVIDDLLLEITPKAMIPQERPPAPVPQDALSLPYLADLSLALPVGNKQVSRSFLIFESYSYVYRLAYRWDSYALSCSSTLLYEVSISKQKRSLLCFKSCWPCGTTTRLLCVIKPETCLSISFMNSSSRDWMITAWILPSNRSKTLLN